MQTAIALPEISAIADRRKPVKRTMTYQVIFCGVDGVVIASDKLEGQHRPDGTIAPGNHVTKLRYSGEFAWAFSGGDLARIFAGYLSERAEEMRGLTDDRLLDFFKDCRESAFAHWASPGPDSTSRVLFVRGSNRSIFKINPVLHTDIERLDDGRGVAGQITNTATFLFRRIYSSGMSVNAIKALAAYAVRTAHLFDSSAIDGLDMAVYTDSESFFQTVDTKPYLGCEAKIEDEFRKVLGSSFEQA